MKRTLCGWKWLGVFVIFFAVLSGCGNDQDSGQILPLSGMISIDGGPPQPLVAANISITINGTTATIVMVNSIALDNNVNSVRTITLVVPTDKLFTPVTLTNTTKLVETTASGIGGTISTGFSSTAISNGKAFLTSIAPNSAVGSFQATFTAGTHTRTVTNASFFFAG